MAWTTQPDATSVYEITGNDDFLYYIGNGAVTMYRYSISANTWTTLAPGVARTSAPAAGASGHWFWDADEPEWTNENAIGNGRYIYSVRGGASAAIDRYDIAANTWSVITYAPATDTFTTGSKYALVEGNLYIQKDATGRCFSSSGTLRSTGTRSHRSRPSTCPRRPRSRRGARTPIRSSTRTRPELPRRRRPAPPRRAQISPPSSRPRPKRSLRSARHGKAATADGNDESPRSPHRRTRSPRRRSPRSTSFRCTW